MQKKIQKMAVENRKSIFSSKQPKIVLKYVQQTLFVYVSDKFQAYISQKKIGPFSQKSLTPDMQKKFKKMAKLHKNFFARNNLK